MLSKEKHTKPGRGRSLVIHRLGNLFEKVTAGESWRKVRRKHLGEMLPTQKELRTQRSRLLCFGSV